MRCKQDPKKSPQKGLGLPIAEGEELDIKAPAVRGPGGRSPYCSGPPTRSWALTKRAVWVETEAGQTVPPEVSISRTFPLTRRGPERQQPLSRAALKQLSRNQPLDMEGAGEATTPLPRRI